MTTALQLRNRLARLHRFPDVTGFDDDMSPVLLDLLNTSASEILDERTWEFQKRDDGVQKFTASDTDTDGLTLVNGSTGIAITSTSGSGLDTTITQHNACSWILATADTSYSETPVRILHCNQTAAAFYGTLESAWEGDAISDGAYRYFAFEYVLPDTVRSVLDVRHQERPLRLYEVATDAEFYRAYPRPHDYLQDSPDFVAVGGSGLTTYDSGTDSAGTRGLVLRVFPVPSADGWLNYSYIYQQPLLAVITDEFTGIPERILGLIVDLAYAKSMQVGVGGEPQTGLALEGRALKEVARKYASDGAAGLRPTPLRSLDSVYPLQVEVGRVPRVVESY